MVNRSISADPLSAAEDVDVDARFPLVVPDGSDWTNGAVTAADVLGQFPAAQAYADELVATGLASAVKFDSPEWQQTIATIADINGVEPLSPDESVPSGQQRTFLGGIYQADEDTDPGDLPVGVGDGTDADRRLLKAICQARGEPAYSAMDWDVLLAAPVTTITTTAQLKTAIDAHQTAWRASKAASHWWIVDSAIASDTITMLADWEIVCGNWVIDFRAKPMKLDPGGSPGVTGVGVVGKTFNIGGMTYAGFSAGGNTTPAGNIAIVGLSYEGNWGGNSGQSKDAVDFLYWARGIWWMNSHFTNPSGAETDGLFDTSYGATCIATYRCHFEKHYKASLVYGNIPGDSPGGSAWPPGHSAGSPGVYLVGVNNRPEVLVAHYEPHWDRIHTRGPEVSFSNAFCHEINPVFSGWGSYKPTGGDNEGHDTVYNWFPEFEDPPANGVRNSGAGSYAANGGELRHDGGFYRQVPPVVAGNATKPIHNAGGADGSFQAGIQQFGGSFLDGAVIEGNTPSFRHAPIYPFSVRASTPTLEASVIAKAGPAGLVNKWSYVGVPGIRGAVQVRWNGVEIGPAGADALAKVIDFIGGGAADLEFDEINQVLTITIDQLLPTRRTATGADTPTGADANGILEINSASPVTVTINGGVFADRNSLLIVQLGAGAVTIAQGTGGMTINKPASRNLVTAEQYAMASLYFRSATNAIAGGMLQVA